MTADREPQTAPRTEAGRRALQLVGTAGAEPKGGWWAHIRLIEDQGGAYALANALVHVRAGQLPEPEGEGWDDEVRMTKRDLHTLLNRTIDHARPAIEAEARADAARERADVMWSTGGASGMPVGVLAAAAREAQPDPRVEALEAVAAAARAVYPKPCSANLRAALERLDALATPAPPREASTAPNYWAAAGHPERDPDAHYCDGWPERCPYHRTAPATSEAAAGIDVEDLADLLMDLRMDGAAVEGWTYQQTMRHYAAQIAAHLSPQPKDT